MSLSLNTWTPTDIQKSFMNFIREYINKWMKQLSNIPSITPKAIINVVCIQISSKRNIV